MMTEVINDVDRTSKEDGVLVEAYLKEVNAALEDQIKSWNTLKHLTIDNEKLVEIFSKETEVKGYVSNRCSLGSAFVKRVDPPLIPDPTALPGSRTVKSRGRGRSSIET